ncbi:MAG: DUF58 domain-containing protein [Acidimicrobiia bacterium]|nr:DUF58 domain-containing protein [Acidimicrobiia bacterium]
MGPAAPPSGRRNRAGSGRPRPDRGSAANPGAPTGDDAGSTGPGRIELTRRGWALLGAAAGLAATGRTLGVVELWIVAVAAIALVAAAVGWALGHRPDLLLRRYLRPALTHVGGAARAELLLENVAARPTAELDLVEPTDDDRRIVLPFGPLPPGGRDGTSHPLPTDRRGIRRLGPAVASFTDPFGLVARSAPVGPEAVLVVGPRVHALAPLAPSPELRPGTRPPALAAALLPAGGEFRSLREYAPGDDLRLVHWATTARTGGLMVRQDRPEDQALVAVTVDVRPGAHDAASFEIACEAVASIAAAARSGGCTVRALTTAGDDLVPGRDARGEALTARLAALAPGGPDRPGRLAATADALRRAAPWARHVVVAGRLDPAEEHALARIASVPGAPRWILVATRGAPSSSAGAVVVDAADGHFPTSWDRTAGGGVGR